MLHVQLFKAVDMECEVATNVATKESLIVDQESTAPSTISTTYTVVNQESLEPQATKQIKAQIDFSTRR